MPKKKDTAKKSVEYVNFASKDAGALVGHRMLHHDSSEYRFGSVILYKPTNDMVPQTQMSEEELMKCLGENSFLAFNPLELLAVVANNKAILNSQNVGALGYYQIRVCNCSTHPNVPILYNAANFKDTASTDRLRIAENGVDFAERGRVIVALRKESEYLGSYLGVLGFERITDKQIGEFLKQ